MFIFNILIRSLLFKFGEQFSRKLNIMRTNLLLFSALVLFTTSCTVTKRTHLPGYHVQWHSANLLPTKQLKKASKQDVNLDAALVLNAPSNSVSELSESEVIFYSDELNSSELSSNSIKQSQPEIAVASNSGTNTFAGDELMPACKKENNSFTEQTRQDNFQAEVLNASHGLESDSQTHSRKKKQSTEPVTNEERKFEGLAIAGFILAIVGWLVPAPAAFILLLLGIIFGAVSMSRVLNEPTKRKGIGMGITALILGILGIVILIAAAG